MASSTPAIAVQICRRPSAGGGPELFWPISNVGRALRALCRVMKLFFTMLMPGRESHARFGFCRPF
jgi:hypothetical protein